jgi:DNA-3-methyladenine glycosylase II
MCTKLTTWCNRRGMAALMGRDVSKLKAKGGGKFKYMSEKEMLEISEKFAPYRYVLFPISSP